MSLVKGLFNPQKGHEPHVDNACLKGTKTGAEESKTIVPIREDVGWDLNLLAMREAIPEGKVGGLVDRVMRQTVSRVSLQPLVNATKTDGTIDRMFKPTLSNSLVRVFH